jgi:hypothetical protein
MTARIISRAGFDIKILMGAAQRDGYDVFKP